MSAIFGIIDFKGRPLKDDWVSSMQADLIHRGPDGQGLYREESAVLGHMLLQVTPESVYDKSPCEEDGFVITGDARLDERESIMDRLGIVGEERDQITDPLLLLHSFKKYGKDFVKDIYGDFAFAIWNKKKRELFCARDHMGVKPFLYYYQNGLFVFSTELRAIMRLTAVNSRLDWRLLRNRTLDISDKSDQTHFRNVIHLPAANVLSVGRTKLSIRCYWRPKYIRDKRFVSEQVSADSLRSTLERVIRDHIRTSGDIGVPLSGGLDSGTIAALTSMAMEDSEKSLYSVSSVNSIAVPCQDIPDEKDFISEILDCYPNIKPIYINNTELSLIDNLEAEYSSQYSPVNAFWYVDRAIFEQLNLNSVRRVLSGLHGDMTVSNSLIDPLPYLLLTGRIRRLVRYLSVLQNISGIGYNKKLLRTIVGVITPRWIRNLIKSFLNGRIASGYSLSELPLTLMKKDAVSLQRRIDGAYRISNSNGSDIANNIWPSGSEMFNEEWDCLASRYNLEISYPLADRRLVELLLRIPVEHFRAGGLNRGLIRKAMEGILPDKIRLRNDKGWYSPGFPQILRNNLEDMIRMADIRSLNSDLEKFLDRQSLKTKLETLAFKKKYNSFATEDWLLIKIFLMDLFVKWSERNN